MNWKAIPNGCDWAVETEDGDIPVKDIDYGYAVLLAAAPELLEACEETIKFFSDWNIQQPPIKIIKEAVKKARGGCDADGDT